MHPISLIRKTCHCRCGVLASAIAGRTGHGIVRRGVARIFTPGSRPTNRPGLGRPRSLSRFRLCEKGLAGTGIPIVGTWCDEGFSGVTRLGERPVGRELVAAVKPGEIIAVYRLDRLTRHAMMGLADLNDLPQRGVGLFIVGDHRFIPPAGGDIDPIDQFSLQQGIVLAQLERDLIVARTEAGKRALIQDGYWPYGVASYGWRREHDGIGYKLVPDDTEQQVLALMRRCHKRGASIPQITAALNEAGFRNRRGEAFEYSAVRWTMLYHEMIQAGVRLAKPGRAKANGNPAIAAAQPAGISAVVQQKLRDAERVGPIIAGVGYGPGLWQLPAARQFAQLSRG